MMIAIVVCVVLIYVGWLAYELLHAPTVDEDGNVIEDPSTDSN